MNAPAKQLSLSPRDWIMMVALSVVFGGAFFFFEIGVRHFAPLTFVWFRVSVAAVLLWGFVLVTGRAIPRQPRVWGAFLVQGFLNNFIPFSLIAWGQLTINSSLSSILNATTPVWTVLIVGLVMADERLTPLKILGVILGVVGVACMIGIDALGGLGGTSALAQVAIVGAAISYGFAGLWGRRFQRFGVDPVVVAAGQVTGAAVLLLPYILFVDPAWEYVGQVPAEAWWSVIGIGLLSTAFAYVLFFNVLANAGATNLSLVTFMVPVSATLLGVLILGERIGWSHILGACVIAVALLLIDGRILKAFRPKSS